MLALLISLLFLVVLLVQVFQTDSPSFKSVERTSCDNLLSSLPERAGVWQGIIGSLMLMAFVVLLAFPFGIGAAIYLEEYAPDTRFTRFININIRNLAGVPSIVYGLLGFASSFRRYSL